MVPTHIDRNCLSPMILPVLAGTWILLLAMGCTIKPRHQLPLPPDESTSGTYQTVYLRVDYDYTYRPGGSGEPGTLDFRGRLSATRPLEEMAVRLRFVDSGGEILHTEVLYSSQHGHKRGSSTITKQFPVVPGTAALAITSTSKEKVFNNN
ncbi:MAG: hypothetical protein WBG37_08925 [Desulfobacterales bacterium]